MNFKKSLNLVALVRTNKRQREREREREREEEEKNEQRRVTWGHVDDAKVFSQNNVYPK